MSPARPAAERQVPEVLDFEEHGGPRLATYRGCQQERGFVAKERWRFEGTAFFLLFVAFWGWVSALSIDLAVQRENPIAVMGSAIMVALAIGLLVQGWAAIAFSTVIRCHGNQLQVSHGPLWTREFVISSLPTLRPKPLPNHWLFQWRGATSEESRGSWGVVFAQGGKEVIVARALSRESALFVAELLNEPS